jgi:hypothetical protein
MAEQQRAFKGVWIPAEIWLNENLSLPEKAVLAEINSFCSRYESCYASNEHFAKFIQVGERRIQKILKSLESKELIEREIVYKKGTKEIEKRFLRVREGWCPNGRTPHDQMDVPPHDQKFADNNTPMNNTKEGIYKRISSKTQKNAEYEDLFSIFYQAYPKKKDKAKAFNAFKKIKPDKALLDEILKALEWQKQQDDWKKDGGQYIPYPATYLNGRRWEDEPTVRRTNAEVDTTEIDELTDILYM